MPDSVFYLLLVAVAAFYLTGAARRRRALMAGLPGAVPGARRGPVPGYAFMPGGALRLEADSQTADWKPVSIETLHAGARTRLILTVRPRGELDATESFTLMKTLAQRVQKRTRAAVVAVQLAPETEDPEAATLVYAPDGRGWTGTGVDAELTANLRGRAPLRL